MKKFFKSIFERIKAAIKTFFSTKKNAIIRRYGIIKYWILWIIVIAQDKIKTFFANITIKNIFSTKRISVLKRQTITLIISLITFYVYYAHLADVFGDYLYNNHFTPYDKLLYKRQVNWLLSFGIIYYALFLPTFISLKYYDFYRRYTGFLMICFFYFVYEEMQWYLEWEYAYNSEFKSKFTFFDIMLFFLINAGSLGQEFDLDLEEEYQEQNAIFLEAKLATRYKELKAIAESHMLWIDDDIHDVLTKEESQELIAIEKKLPTFIPFGLSLHQWAETLTMMNELFQVSEDDADVNDPIEQIKKIKNDKELRAEIKAANPDAVTELSEEEELQEELEEFMAVENAKEEKTINKYRAIGDYYFKPIWYWDPLVGAPNYTWKKFFYIFFVHRYVIFPITVWLISMYLFTSSGLKRPPAIGEYSRFVNDWYIKSSNWRWEGKFPRLIILVGMSTLYPVSLFRELKRWDDRNLEWGWFGYKSRRKIRHHYRWMIFNNAFLNFKKIDGEYVNLRIREMEELKEKKTN